MPEPHTTIRLRYAMLSDTGRRRHGNEDSAYVGARLLAVADGLGGHAGGELASAAAIDALRGLDDGADIAPDGLAAALSAAVGRASQALNEIAAADPAMQGLGTTLTAMLWSGAHFALLQVGDSRAYRLRGGRLRLITHDQTLVQALVDDGRITEEEARSHPHRSLLLQALDGGDIFPSLQLGEALPGDRYLLCSDGLTAVLTDEGIAQVLTGAADPQLAVESLVRLANTGGGPDNITCVIADVIEQADGPAAG